MRLILQLVATCLVVTGCASTPRAAQEPDPLDDLQWMVGAWEGEGLGGAFEETWSHPRGGAMMGTFRLLNGGTPFVYEFFLIEKTDEGVRMSFRHISPGWEIWERDIEVPPTLYLEESGPQRARFVAPTAEHSPGSIEYWRVGPSLMVRVGERDPDAPASFELEMTPQR
ncbi:MAG: DUF6265 family protein [Planctomycetota bacterium]